MLGFCSMLFSIYSLQNSFANFVCASFTFHFIVFLFPLSYILPLRIVFSNYIIEPICYDFSVGAS